MEKEKVKEPLKTKIANGIQTFKSHWGTPPKGYQVCYREFAAFAAGCGSPNLLGVLTQYTTIATSVHLMISYVNRHGVDPDDPCIGYRHPSFAGFVYDDRQFQR